MQSLGRILSLLPEAVREAFADEAVTELMINGPGEYWVERGADMELVAAPDLSAEDVRAAALHIARPLGLDVGEGMPTADARLDDGSRVAIAVPPVVQHAALAIRRFGGRQFSAADLVEMGSLPEDVLEAAREALAGRRNILIAGGTGSGKTTLLQALAGLIPEGERLVVIEDTSELRLDARNQVQMEARQLNGAGPGIRDLVRTSLRFRPDRLVLGEVRGGEAADLIQALNTGHGGSMSTIHANDAASALTRLATCALQGSDGISWQVLGLQVAQAIDLVIHVERREGRREVTSAIRVDGFSGDGWNTRPLWPKTGR